MLPARALPLPPAPPDLCRRRGRLFSPPCERPERTLRCRREGFNCRQRVVPPYRHPSGGNGGEDSHGDGHYSGEHQDPRRRATATTTAAAAALMGEAAAGAARAMPPLVCVAQASAAAAAAASTHTRRHRRRAHAHQHQHQRPRIRIILHFNRYTTPD